MEKGPEFGIQGDISTRYMRKFPLFYLIQDPKKVNSQI